MTTTTERYKVLASFGFNTPGLTGPLNATDVVLIKDTAVSCIPRHATYFLTWNGGNTVNIVCNGNDESEHTYHLTIDGIDHTTIHKTVKNVAWNFSW